MTGRDHYQESVDYLKRAADLNARDQPYSKACMLLSAIAHALLAIERSLPVDLGTDA